MPFFAVQTSRSPVGSEPSPPPFGPCGWDSFSESGTAPPSGVAVGVGGSGMVPAGRAAIVPSG